MYRGRHAGSPPPTSPEGSSDRGEDQTVGKPFDKEADSGENAHEAPGMTGSARRNPVMMKPVHTPSGVPANPFSRTLATIEGPEKDDGVSEQPAGQSRGMSRICYSLLRTWLEATAEPSNSMERELGVR